MSKRFNTSRLRPTALAPFLAPSAPKPTHVICTAYPAQPVFVGKTPRVSNYSAVNEVFRVPVIPSILRVGFLTFCGYSQVPVARQARQSPTKPTRVIPSAAGDMLLAFRPICKACPAQPLLSETRQARNYSAVNDVCPSAIAFARRDAPTSGAKRNVHLTK